jgi:hypothetical protein
MSTARSRRVWGPSGLPPVVAGRTLDRDDIMRNPLRFVRSLSTLSFLAVFAVSTTPLAGQESTTRGLNLGFHLQAASLSVQEEEGEGGGGAGFRIGYGINRIVTLYFEADGVSVSSENSDEFQGTWTLAHADLGARFHFANTLRSWVPYLDVAFGARGASVKDVEANGESIGDITFNGGSFSFGGGINLYFKQTFAMDVGLKFSDGTFNEVELGAVSLNNLDIDATSVRFKVGVVWWP